MYIISKLVVMLQLKYDISCSLLLLHVMMILSRKVKILYNNKFLIRAEIRLENCSSLLLVLHHNPILFYFHWNSFQFLPGKGEIDIIGYLHIFPTWTFLQVRDRCMWAVPCCCPPCLNQDFEILQNLFKALKLALVFLLVLQAPCVWHI